MWAHVGLIHFQKFTMWFHYSDLWMCHGRVKIMHLVLCISAFHMLKHKPILTRCRQNAFLILSKIILLSFAPLIWNLINVYGRCYMSQCMSKKPHLHHSKCATAGSNWCCVEKNRNILSLETFSILHPYSSGHKMSPNSFTLPPDQEALIHIWGLFSNPKLDKGNTQQLVCLCRSDDWEQIENVFTVILGLYTAVN